VGPVVFPASASAATFRERVASASTAVPLPLGREHPLPKFSLPDAREQAQPGRAGFSTWGTLSPQSSLGLHRTPRDPSPYSLWSAVRRPHTFGGGISRGWARRASGGFPSAPTPARGQPPDGAYRPRPGNVTPSRAGGFKKRRNWFGGWRRGEEVVRTSVASGDVGVSA
jgi:hypothetical protein